MVATKQRGTVMEAARRFALTRIEADMLLRILRKRGLASRVGFRSLGAGRPAAVWEWPPCFTISEVADGH